MAVSYYSVQPKARVRSRIIIAMTFPALFESASMVAFLQIGGSGGPALTVMTPICGQGVKDK